MSEPISSLELEIVSGSKSAVNGIDALTQSLNKLGSSLKGASTPSHSFTTGLKSVTTSIKKIYNTLKPCITEINNYVENINLFTVSMREFAESATQYANEVADVMGIDPSEWMRNQGVFMTLAKGFGSTSERANTMSKNLTQLGYDISSFFNIEVSDAMQKLQSGISGELEPLRRLGYDLSQARLEAVALELGITKSVSAMTQAEKAELRYHAIMTQVTQVQGDMADTLTQPANQLRILKAQVTQLTRAIGSAFIPILIKILPYLISVTKVVREVVSAIATLFGFTMPEVDMSRLTESASGATDALDNATESAKKLKDYTMGFDELNVINPSSGEDNSALGGAGFDFDLLEYDFIGKATSNEIDGIVTKMKEWLGITGEITSWGDLFKTKLGKILAVVGAIGSAFGAWKIVKGVSSIFGLFGGSKSGGKGLQVPNVKTVLKGLADMAIIIGGAVVLVTAIGAFMSIPYFDEFLKTGITSVTNVFKGLWDIAIPIVAASAYIVVLGTIGVGTVAKGLADMAIIIGGAVAIITAVGALISIPYFSDFLDKGIASTQKVFNGLYDIALPIGVLSGIIAVLGFASPAVILSGLAGFALVIGGLEAVLVALGALNQIPGFEWIVGEGGKVLSQLGKIIGDFGGSIIGGFAEGLSSSLPQIGENLASFAEKAKPFITGMSEISDGAVDGVSKLASMILKLTVADVIDGLTSWLTGGNSLEKFGQELANFAPHFAEYAKAMEGVKPDVVKASSDAAQSVAEFAKNVPNEGGVAAWFAGENSLSKFGQDLASFAPNFKKYAQNMEGVKPDVVESSSTAVQSVLEFAKNVPNEGGVAAWFAGENTLDKIGDKLPDFAANFKKYSDTMAGVKPDVVEKSSKAVESVLAFADNVPNEGGVAGWFAGENTIDKIGDKLPSFAKKFKEYSDTMAGVKPDVVEKTSKAVESVLEFADNVPNEGGVASWFAGENAIDKFGDKLPSFAKNMKAYSEEMSGVKLDVVSKSTAAAQAIVAMCDNIPNGGGVASWFAGDNGVDKFGEKLAKFGVKFKEYYDTIKGISISTLTSLTDGINRVINFAVRIKKEVDQKSITNFADALDDLAKSIKNLPSSKTITITVKQVNESTVVAGGNSTLNVPMYANGAYDIPTGQMFIAREAGAEMVGSIGRKTAVANNDQIVSGIANGVAEANGEQNVLLREQNTLLRALLEKEGNVYLDGRKVTETVDRHHRERGRTIMVGGAY